MMRRRMAASNSRGIGTSAIWKTNRRAITYLMLCGVGLLARTQLTPADWCSTNRQNECSIYTIGLIMLQKINTSPPGSFPSCLRNVRIGLAKLGMSEDVASIESARVIPYTTYAEKR